mmetsp:Transcript_17050/g.18994  ORF Transcript_17050/g.18994 Transcript_17050/m.18994 type:complete len:210 (-) Transcript_17050:90-719(-)|eukprot:CAMPEP_0168534056 /NCGR_PEP_ID=MMETSP0405-20121227/17584_1 /TAXON_ID=498012 /ORGANISM="Trichosphaerium sp, Strain Am-I-7 wt" /LENGTH=209 /DNA_ID=CAMNT_0008560513 /DNA_START=77 /DNA_END=706 /DNA_ORIENTATION=-
MGCLNDKETSEQVAARFRPFKTRHASPLDVKTYKIVFLGKSGVGKTSILMRYSQEVFHPTVDSTIGAVFSTKTIKTPDNKMMTIEMWDTAGQERFKAMMPIYYRVADAAVLVYDITSKESFTEVNYWYKELRSQVGDCLIFVAGNKIDVEEDRQVTLEEATEYCNARNLQNMEMSSKSGENVQDFFGDITQQLIGRVPKKEQENKDNNT